VTSKAEGVARKIDPEFDERGAPVWRSRMTPPDNTYAELSMVPDRVIPVVFVPGVMGSNLEGIGKGSGYEWLLDSTETMIGWALRGPEVRKNVLTPATMEVTDKGRLSEGTRQKAEELRRRKWGEIGFMSYSKALVWLENALNDYHDPHAGERVKLMKDALQASVGERALTEDEVGLSYRYLFPVHACGYNWLADNKISAARLGKRIDEIIARYRKEGRKCEKVIVVTHSMGGLVARHCSEVLGYRDKIFGIVHGVMPAIGAAAVYRRFKAGTEDYTPVYDLESGITSEILGGDAAAMTAVLSSAPGPLQLLPTPEYGNGWLTIEDGSGSYSLPAKGDPYSEIYAVRGKWWSMAEDRLINPLNKETDRKKHQRQVDADWEAFADLISENVKNFHEEIRSRYHPNTHAFYGSASEFKAYGSVKWSGALRGPVDSTLFRNRPIDVLEARQLSDKELLAEGHDAPEIGTERSVEATYTDKGWFPNSRRQFFLSMPDENGDGTVPERSGVAPKAHCKSLLRVKVGHEPAYNPSKGSENVRALRFTIRAIVWLAQAVQTTSMKYDN